MQRLLPVAARARTYADWHQADIESIVSAGPGWPVYEVLRPLGCRGSVRHSADRFTGARTGAADPQLP